MKVLKNVLKYSEHFFNRNFYVNLLSYSNFFQISHGPQICIHIHANVTMPDMKISSDVLEFGDVKCGECRIVTVQLYNHKEVRCDWNSLPIKKKKKVI